MRIGILCSIPNEIKHFNLVENSFQEFGGKIFYKTKIESSELIIAQCGIGKVNAAIASTLLIQKFECNLIIFSGIAGGIDPSLEIGDAIVGESLIQYDYGQLKNEKINIFRAGEIPLGVSEKDNEFFLDNELKKKIKLKLPELKMGKILTSDTYVNCSKTSSNLFKKFGAQVVDMESAAVAQVSEQFEINSIMIRSISDFAGIDKKISSYNINIASKKSFEIVKKVLKIIN